LKELLRNPAVYAILAYILLFLTSVWAFGAEPIKNTIDYVVVGFSLLFFYKWWPNTWEAFRSGGIEKKFRLSLGLSLMAAGLAGQRIWIIIINQFGAPEWIDRNLVSGFIGSWFVGAILLCLSIDSAEDGLFTHLKGYYTTILIGLGTIAGFVIAKVFFP